jgi:hypothetical protein
MQLDEITDLEKLKEFLGYQDDRSALKWCRRNSIPILKAGKKKYVSSHLLTLVIENQLVTFVQESQSAKPILNIYTPKNGLITKYVSKYESANKTNLAKKAAA